jgi:hypothetical protein
LGIYMTSFPSLVASAFEFLVVEHGFQRVDRPDNRAGELVEYVKEPITISFGWYKGEIDINFCVSIQFTEGHKIFRPYLSRTFGLTEIAVRQNSNAFASWAKRPEMGGSITTSEHAALFLSESARIMRLYCIPILQGNLAIFEEITKERSVRSCG